LTLRRGLRPVPTILLTALVAALLLPGLAAGPSLDASVFSTVGWRLADGDALYAQVWDHKPPGMYLPYLAAHLITDDAGGAWGTVWVSTVACVAAAALVVGALLAREGTGWFAWLAAALAAVGSGSYLLSLGGGLGESIALLPISLAVLTGVSGRWFVSGLLAGAAIAISLQALPVLAAVAVLGLTDDRQATMLRAGAVVLGVGMVCALAVVGLSVNGGLGDMPEALLDYSAAYRAVTSREGGASAWSLVPWTVLVLLPLVVGVGLAVVQRRRLASPRVALASSAWIAVGILVIVLQGRFYAHYATPLVIPMAILAGLGLHAMWSSLPRRIALPTLGIPLVLSLGLSLAVGAAGARDEQEPIRASNQRAATVAAVVRSLTTPADLIFVWGNDARLYELADRVPASRYAYFYPLLTPGFVDAERIGSVLSELEGAPPAVIIDSGSLEPGAPGLPPLLIGRPVATDGRDADLLDPIRTFVSDNYQEVEVVEGWPIYRYLSGESSLRSRIHGTAAIRKVTS
jgi:hypothetical protein